MGFTHNTAMSQFVPPSQCAFTAGTWTPTITSDVPTLVRTAADVDNTIIIPLNVPSNGAYRAGSRIASVDVYYLVGTANLTAVTPTVEKVTLTADGSAPTGAAVTAVTYNKAAADRIGQASHTLTMTFNSPPWVDDGNAYYLDILLDTGATAVFTFKGVRINYTDRR
jgi:hypothetical protein